MRRSQSPLQKGLSVQRPSGTSASLRGGCVCGLDELVQELFLPTAQLLGEAWNNDHDLIRPWPVFSGWEALALEPVHHLTSLQDEGLGSLQCGCVDRLVGNPAEAVHWQLTTY